MSRYFFVGIGGIGMSALAELFLSKGHSVEGSDVVMSDSVERLISKGIRVHLGHDSQSFLAFAPDFLVVNSAISLANPILLEAKKLGCRVIHRGELLAECLNAHEGLVVAGSHGKTTTSSMLAYLLNQSGQDVSFAIGGRLSDTGDNAHLGSSPFFVAEGDESDASFLKLKPKVLGVTNLDADHMSTYGHSFEALVNHFAEWILGLPISGTAVLNSDDAGLRAVLEKISEKDPQFWETRKLILMGKVLPEIWESSISGFFCLEEVIQKGAQVEVQFSLNSPFCRPPPPLRGRVGWGVVLPLIGEFNVRNALMAVAMASAIGVNQDESLAALKNYPGVRRRMQCLGEVDSVLIFEDYGHHPTEIAASIQGLKAAYPNRRLIHVFQLHRYTRTRDLWEDFVEVLSLSDELLLFPIYPASEPEIPGVTAERLVQTIHQEKLKPVRFVASLGDAFHQIKLLLQSGDILMLQGAGDLPRFLGHSLVKV